VKSLPGRGNRHKPFLWTRGIAARETLFYLDRHGIDAEPLLSKVELSRSQLAQDAKGVSVAAQHQFLELATIETEDPLLGLHVAAEVDLRDIGLLFYLAASSATEEKGARVVAVRGPGGRRRFLADRAPLLGASIARAQAQRRMDVGRAPITVAPQHGNDAPNRTSIGCAMVGLKMGTGEPMP